MEVWSTGLRVMRYLVGLHIHLSVTSACLLGPGSLRSAGAESLLVKYQLKILNRSREHPPNFKGMDGVIMAVSAGRTLPKRKS